MGTNTTSCIRNTLDSTVAFESTILVDTDLETVLDPVNVLVLVEVLADEVLEVVVVLDTVVVLATPGSSPSNTPLISASKSPPTAVELSVLNPAAMMAKGVV
eukprot:GFYU01052423.1.p2 GENE.GFYU01052423.1~~GFYU01052423.1.p2  ORF type:complete len:102 (+),score=15.57 GFYU01052423.1:94-399(+)